MVIPEAKCFGTGGNLQMKNILVYNFIITYCYYYYVPTLRGIAGETKAPAG